MKSFQIKYKHISEIRHGSPYNLAELEIVGENRIKIEPNNSWQDKHSWSKNGKYVAQIKWDFENNAPGFRVIIIDTATGGKLQSDWIQGCCHKLRLRNDLSIYYETFTLISENMKKKIYGLKSNEIIIEQATTKNKRH